MKKLKGQYLIWILKMKIGINMKIGVKNTTVSSLTMMKKNVLYAMKIIPMKISPYELLSVVIKYVRDVLKTHSMLGVVCAEKRREYSRYSRDPQFHREWIGLIEEMQ